MMTEYEQKLEESRRLMELKEAEVAELNEQVRGLHTHTHSHTLSLALSRSLSLSLSLSLTHTHTHTVCHMWKC